MTTLDKWLNIKVKQYDIKRYFYCDWSNQFTPPPAQWLSKKPKDVNYCELIRWPDVDRNHAFFYVLSLKMIKILNSILKKKQNTKMYHFLFLICKNLLEK